jgi:hypothetical protein
LNSYRQVARSPVLKGSSTKRVRRDRYYKLGSCFAFQIGGCGWRGERAGFELDIADVMQSEGEGENGLSEITPTNIMGNTRVHETFD